MNPRDQSALSNVPRRHGESSVRLVLLPLGDVPPYRAVRPAGARQVEVAGVYAFGVSVPSRRNGVGVAVVGDMVTSETFNWAPGLVFYDGSGVLTQFAGLRIGYAISATELLVNPE